MSPTQYGVRRATSDDLPQLVALWRGAQLEFEVLEKRFTEFQVVEENGKLAGAIGLAVVGRHGLVHSESIPDFALVDTLRPLLWSRLQSVAGNHGLFRLWTSESAPFWKQHDWVEPDATTLERLPESFVRPRCVWLTLQLKNEAVLDFSLDKEFALFRESEKERTAQLMDQARMMKGFATLLAIALFISVVAACAYLLKSRFGGGR